jgi:type III pantothenate kinase
MNLIADIGNTSTKLAVYDGKKMLSSSTISELNCKDLDDIFSSKKIRKAIISSVRDIPEFVSDLLFRNIPIVHILSYKSKLPFRIEYDTPETLGTDRIAAVAGAYALYPGRDVLIIDAGTAITYELLLGKIYKGGNISPGVMMRFMALNHFTGKLPLVTPSWENTTPGSGTAEAINAGVICGVLYEINEYIRTFEEKYPGIRVIFTGGDAAMIREKITYRADYQPGIVMDGLNNILEYNAK